MVPFYRLGKFHPFPTFTRRRTQRLLPLLASHEKVHCTGRFFRDDEAVIAQMEILLKWRFQMERNEELYSYGRLHLIRWWLLCVALEGGGLTPRTL